MNFSFLRLPKSQRWDIFSSGGVCGSSFFLSPLPKTDSTIASPPKKISDVLLNKRFMTARHEEEWMV